MNKFNPVTSGDNLTATLRECGIDTVFGIPGTQNIHLYECFRRASFRCVLATTETSAAFMANGFYRSSGKLCAVASIPGPGFTYALTGIAEAFHDSAALVYIMQIKTSLHDKAFRLQDIDLKAVAKPVSKGLIEIATPAQVSDGIREACRLAISGEPGPVIVTVTNDAVVRPADVRQPESKSAESEELTPLLDQVVAALAPCKRIAIFAGQGAFGASGYTIALAERLNAPVVTTGAGRGVIPESHPLSIDLDFSLGHERIINELFSECDAVLALGCKLGHNGTRSFKLNFGPGIFIHVDTSEEVLQSLNYRPHLAIKADAARFTEALLDRSQNLDIVGFGRDHLAELKSELQHLKRSQIDCEPIIAEYADGRFETFFESFNSLIGPETVLVTDSGLHQNITRVYSRVYHPRQLITPSDFQSTGYGIPAGLGAKAARPDANVIVFTGDGSFAINAMELRMAAGQGLDIGVIVFNDSYLGSIRMQQSAAFGETICVNMVSPDYSRLCEALGIAYYTLGEAATGTIERFLNDDGVRLLELKIQDPPELEAVRAKAKLREQLSHSPVASAIKKIKDWIRRDG